MSLWHNFQNGLFSLQIVLTLWPWSQWITVTTVWLLPGKWIWLHTFSCGSILAACFLINFLRAPSLSVSKGSPVELLRLSFHWVPWAQWFLNRPFLWNFVLGWRNVICLSFWLWLLVREARNRKYEYFLEEAMSTYMHIKRLTAEDSKALKNID